MDESPTETFCVLFKFYGHGGCSDDPVQNGFPAKAVIPLGEPRSWVRWAASEAQRGRWLWYFGKFHPGTFIGRPSMLRPSMFGARHLLTGPYVSLFSLLCRKKTTFLNAATRLSHFFPFKEYVSTMFSIYEYVSHFLQTEYGSKNIGSTDSVGYLEGLLLCSLHSAWFDGFLTRHDASLACLKMLIHDFAMPAHARGLHTWVCLKTQLRKLYLFQFVVRKSSLYIDLSGSYSTVTSSIILLLATTVSELLGCSGTWEADHASAVPNFQWDSTQHTNASSHVPFALGQTQRRVRRTLSTGGRRCVVMSAETDFMFWKW